MGEISAETLVLKTTSYGSLRTETTAGDTSMTITSDNQVFPHRDHDLSFQHAVEIAQPFGRLDMILSWCRSELVDQDWRWQMVESSSDRLPGRYVFYFPDSRDYCCFKLKWT